MTTHSASDTDKWQILVQRFDRELAAMGECHPEFTGWTLEWRGVLDDISDGANARIKELEAWSQKRLIVSGPIQYDVLGAENVKNHETVHDFIEVLSPPSTEATLAICAHTNLMQQLSNALETITTTNARADEAEADRDALLKMVSCPRCHKKVRGWRGNSPSMGQCDHLFHDDPLAAARRAAQHE